MIPFLTTPAAVVVIVVYVMLIRSSDQQAKAQFATVNAVIAAAVLLNAIGDISNDWLTALIWTASLFVAVKCALRYRRLAAEAAPKHEEVR